MPPGYCIQRRTTKHALCKAKCSHALMAALNEIRSAICGPAWLRKLKANCQLDDFSSDHTMAERLRHWDELICSPRTPSFWQEWRRAHEAHGFLDWYGNTIRYKHLAIKAVSHLTDVLVQLANVLQPCFVSSTSFKAVQVAQALMAVL